MRRGGGVGYNFSAIRPKGARVHSTSSSASGPCSYMDVFDASCRTVESAGSRRGAQMGMLDCTHPDLLEFIDGQAFEGPLEQLQRIGGGDRRVHAGRRRRCSRGNSCIARSLRRRCARRPTCGSATTACGSIASVRAREVWDVIMRSTYDVAEPGIVFMSRMNDDNNLRAIETIRATNPCGEQPLPAYGCCNLGPLNLTRFVRRSVRAAARRHAVVRLGRARANARARRCAFSTTCSTSRSGRCPSKTSEAQAKRRIGVGFTGLGDTLVMLGMRYDSPEGREFAMRVARTMRDEAYRASVELARERGAFPLLQRERSIWKQARSRRACPRTSRKTSARPASATATCCRSRRRAP